MNFCEPSFVIILKHEGSLKRVLLFVIKVPSWRAGKVSELCASGAVRYELPVKPDATDQVCLVPRLYKESQVRCRQGKVPESAECQLQNKAGLY